MSRPWDWPALAGALAAGLPRFLTAEQGIWGKVHGARSDFRWIAVTRDFLSLGADFERELAVGIEDRPARFPLWRAAPGVHLAGVGYPSRARDAAGRGGALEKNVLGWRYDGRIPAALAALLLLPRAAELDDNAWWGRADPSEWDGDPRFALDLGEPREIPISEEVLEATLAEAIASLRASLPPETAEPVLAELYSGLLADRRPLLLPAGPEPLPAPALAALLLPLDRDRADRVSLAGWLPSSRPPRAELGERWDVIARPAVPAQRGAPELEDPRARAMAAVLLAGEPSALAGGRRPDRAAFVAPFHTATREPAARLPPRRSEQAARTGAALPVLRLPPDLPEPPAGAARGWWLLHDLARDPNRFWLDPQDLAPHLPKAHENDDRRAIETALGWLDVLASHRAPGTAGEQLQAKEDLLRAAILALSPTPATLDALGTFRSDRVPPILYLAALPPEDWHRVRRTLGDLRVAELIQVSKRRCAPELSRAIEPWLAGM